jgi:hypothetical protein
MQSWEPCRRGGGGRCGGDWEQARRSWSPGVGYAEEGRERETEGQVEASGCRAEDGQCMSGWIRGKRTKGRKQRRDGFRGVRGYLVMARRHSRKVPCTQG